MLLTIILGIICCAGISGVLISAIVFIQDNWMFSSAPKEAKEKLQQRSGEVFYGAKAMGWVVMILSALSITGAFVIAVWDGFRNGFTFFQFFLRLAVMLTMYKAFDMIFFDYFLLCRFHFFQHYFPEAAEALVGRKYGFNIKSQLLKLIVIFPGIAALVAWICTRV